MNALTAMSRAEPESAGAVTSGYVPTEVDTAIVSHLREDHIGGLRERPAPTCWLRPPNGPNFMNI